MVCESGLWQMLIMEGDNMASAKACDNDSIFFEVYLQLVAGELGQLYAQRGYRREYMSRILRLVTMIFISEAHL